MTVSSSPSPLAGRRILITGAGSGIGKATAQLFTARAARVALVDNNLQAVTAVGDELKMPIFGCDVSNPDQVERMIPEAATALQGIDGIVNAAGIFMGGAIEDLRVHDWHRVMNINLLGPFLICRQALPALRQAASATIVNIGSIAGLQPAHGVAAYASSKAGLFMLSKCMAFEFGPTIRVNTVCPGAIETPMIQNGLTEDARARLQAANASKRLGRPEEIAEAILYLSSPASSYVNGATLVVDGGYSWR
ncbi:3-oxoacyl-ACP reductase [Acidocella aquatica]|uniref:3-oxoacyl-ACP reductase n=1 Tax=Acidocella aquatica TaxID=1922313 RepID=A0ABQ6A6R3_9PROT|nr:SDR family oxidoreductase [Acidocella aquatica]GLR66990.1 3-oxoacyl-ACP reductase [Acidocella aquatica]